LNCLPFLVLSPSARDPSGNATALRCIARFEMDNSTLKCELWSGKFTYLHAPPLCRSAVRVIHAAEHSECAACVGTLTLIRSNQSTGLRFVSSPSNGLRALTSAYIDEPHVATVTTPLKGKRPPRRAAFLIRIVLQPIPVLLLTLRRDVLLQEVELLFEGGRLRFGRIADVHQNIRLGVIGWPFRHARPVGVSGFHEIRPHC
jgi:hypothetical protein